MEYSLFGGNIFVVNLPLQYHQLQIQLCVQVLLLCKESVFQQITCIFSELNYLRNVTFVIILAQSLLIIIKQFTHSLFHNTPAATKFLIYYNSFKLSRQLMKNWKTMGTVMEKVKMKSHGLLTIPDLCDYTYANNYLEHYFFLNPAQKNQQVHEVFCREYIQCCTRSPQFQYNQFLS